MRYLHTQGFLVLLLLLLHAGQFVMQGYLHMKISPILRILVTRSVALVPALTVAVLTRNSAESTALDTLNQWLNLVSSSS